MNRFDSPSPGNAHPWRDDEASAPRGTSRTDCDGRSFPPGQMGIYLLLDGEPSLPRLEPPRPSRRALSIELGYWRAQVTRYEDRIDTIAEVLAARPSEAVRAAYANAHASWQTALRAVDATARKLAAASSIHRDGRVEVERPDRAGLDVRTARPNRIDAGNETSIPSHAQVPSEQSR